MTRAVFGLDVLNCLWRRLPWQVWMVLGLVCAGLVVFSQTVAVVADEGIHLLSAMLVNAGKLPYRDYFYQHPPAFTYLYAGWMRVFGETWRSAHLLSALLTAGAIWIVVDYAVSREREAKAMAGIVVAVLLGLNFQVVQLGTGGHPYALCMLLSVLAFRIAVVAIRKDEPRWLLLAGASAGGAALSSLLAAPLVPIIALWLVAGKEVRNRAIRLSYFVVGVAAWLIPLAVFFVQAPQAFLFDVVEYHLFYRSYARSPWLSDAGVLGDGLYTMGRWLGNGEGLPRTLLALVGIWSLLRPGVMKDVVRDEMRLAASILLGLVMFLATPNPTYAWYFVIAAPFLAIVAWQGALSVARVPWFGWRHSHVLPVIAAIISVMFLRASAINMPTLIRLEFWKHHEAIAREVDRIAVQGAPVYFPEALIYFVAKRLPPSGLENDHAPELVVPPELASLIKVVPQSRIDDWIKEGRFEVVWMEDDDPRKDSLGLDTRFRNRAPLAKSTTETGQLYWESMR